MGRPPKPQLDPALLREQQAARSDKQSAIQSRVSSVTEQLIRIFGSRSALSGAKTRAPILGR